MLGSEAQRLRLLCSPFRDSHGSAPSSFGSADSYAAPEPDAGRASKCEDVPDGACACLEASTDSFPFVPVDWVFRFFPYFSRDKVRWSLTHHGSCSCSPLPGGGVCARYLGFGSVSGSSARSRCAGSLHAALRPNFLLLWRSSRISREAQCPIFSSCFAVPAVRED